MNDLKRELAPITDKAWEEIEDQAKEVLEERLTARRIVDVSDPAGWEKSAMPEGRLGEIEETGIDGVEYGVRQTRPFLETRVSFELGVWELDDVNRGAEDVDLEPLETAAAKAADFEEKAVYEGISRADIGGLIEEAEISLSLPEDLPGLVETISEAVRIFKESAIEGPYGIAVGPETWNKINQFVQGYPVDKKLSELLEGPIVYSPNLKTPLVVSLRGGDFDLTLGRDFAIGYQDHDSEEVTLFITESFSFKVLDPAASIALD